MLGLSQSHFISLFNKDWTEDVALIIKQSAAALFGPDLDFGLATTLPAQFT